jgi:Alpha-2-macroglobulin family
MPMDLWIIKLLSCFSTERKNNASSGVGPKKYAVRNDNMNISARKRGNVETGKGGSGVSRALTRAQSEMMALDLTSSGGGNAPINVRREFPETWLWEDFMTDNCEPVKLSKVVPDTITTWLISAFSLNEANGFGVNANPTSLTVFRPFFISTTLPYSVKRGEQLTLSVQIFNYLSSDQDVSVTMFNEKEEFQFTDETDFG